MYMNETLTHWAMYLYPDRRITLCGQKLPTVVTSGDSYVFMNEIRVNTENPVTCFNCNLECIELLKRYVDVL